MRRIDIDHVKPGMILGRSINTADGSVLLGAGMPLKVRYIEKLKQLGIYQIYIEDELSKDIVIKDIISDEIRTEAKFIVKDVMHKTLQEKTEVSFDALGRVVNKMVDELLDNPNALLNLGDIRLVDDYTFCHSVNVCVLSLVTGIAMELDQLRLRDLGMGALLHDIGKIKIPMSILTKPDQLTDVEYDEIKKHAVFGFDILRNSDSISRLSAAAALGHHERYNGSGYPNGLSNSNIHDFAKIVAVADVYDAMTSDRVYRRGVEPYQAIEYLVGMGNILFDYNVVRVFTQHISIYPPGSGVILNTKAKGLVIENHREFPTRPKLRLIYDESGRRYDPYKEIDLLEHPTVFITEVCHDLN